MGLLEEVPIISPGIRETRNKVAHYRRAVKERAAEQDKALLSAYRQILKGERIIDLNHVMRYVGVAAGRPRLAIAQASQRWCYWHTSGTEYIFYSGPTKTASREVTWKSRTSVKRKLVVPGMPLSPKQYGDSAYAMVPIVPPECQKKGVSLASRFTLWEAEWEDEPPGDPLLLKRIGNSCLFQIEAAWDLTELEQSVLYDMRMKE